jgi:hypothetical protein
MRRDDHHLDDHELLLSLDRELAAPEQRRADDHLTSCGACRDRRTRLLAVSTAVAENLEHDVEDAERVQQSRARLAASLAEAANHEVRTFGAGFFAQLQRVAVPAAVVATLAALLFVRIGRTPAPSRAPGGSATAHDATLPIPTLTPGATWTITAAELCAAADRERREIPAAVRDEVLRNYGMTAVSADDYELDYLITPELGGSPDPRNLWPQRYAAGMWDAHVKDQLEDLLPGLVCEGRIPLRTAQQDIAANWIAAYKRYFHTNVPLPRRLASAAARGWPLAEDDGLPLRRATAAPGLRLVTISTAR